MKTEQALDFAYENPYICITTESLYEYDGKFFYFDNAGNLKNNFGEIITENKLYEMLPEVKDEEFNDWIEVEGEIPEKYDDDSYDDLLYEDDDE